MLPLVKADIVDGWIDKSRSAWARLEHDGVVYVPPQETSVYPCLGHSLVDIWGLCGDNNHGFEQVKIDTNKLDENGLVWFDWVMSIGAHGPCSPIDPKLRHLVPWFQEKESDDV